MYVYMPERNVFKTTPRNMQYTFVAYMFAVLVLNMMRWKTVQGYEREQYEMQQQYAKTLQEKMNSYRRQYAERKRLMLPRLISYQE